MHEVQQLPQTSKKCHCGTTAATATTVRTISTPHPFANQGNCALITELWIRQVSTKASMSKRVDAAQHYRSPRSPDALMPSYYTLASKALRAALRSYPMIECTHILDSTLASSY